MQYLVLNVLADYGIVVLNILSVVLTLAGAYLLYNVGWTWIKAVVLNRSTNYWDWDSANIDHDYDDNEDDGYGGRVSVRRHKKYGDQIFDGSTWVADDRLRD